MARDPVDYDSQYEVARRDHLVEGSPAPPRIGPTFWPDAIADIPAALNEPSASYACRDAVKILKGIGDEALHKAAFQMEQTFEWIGNGDEIISDGPNGLSYYPARCVLQGALQYLDHCLEELRPPDVVDGELGQDHDAATLYALLSVSLFARALLLKVHETPNHNEYADIIGTACYAASEARNRRVIAETRDRLTQLAAMEQANARTEQQKRLNAARHKNARTAKAQVLQWWNDKDYARHFSKADAANGYPEVLEALGLRNGDKLFKPSTVENWLAEGRRAEGKATE